MLYLINAAEEQGLRNIVNQATEYKNVHGIMVDIHPLWLEAWKMHLTNPDLDFRDYVFDLGLYRYQRIMRDFNNLDFSDFEGPLFPVTTNININWFPNDWDQIFHKSNLVVRILLRPGTEYIRISYEGPMIVFQEHREVPRFAASPTSAINPLVGGVSIGHSSSIAGTLGGILTGNGKTYGVTCAHVLNSTGLAVDQPAQKDSGSASPIGETVFVDHPAVKASTSLCNVYAPGTQFNDMDLALIEIEGGVSADKELLNIGAIDGFMPSAQLHRNLAVEYTGRSSSHKSLILGGIGVTNEIQFGKDSYCFQHLIELKEPLLSKLLLKRPVRQGDSGAWVTAQGNSGTEWCAMVIGEDRQTGYALMSEKIMNNLSSNGYALTCS